MIRALTLICTRLSKTLFFNFYSIENQLFLGSVVRAICKSPFMNKTFRAASCNLLRFNYLSLLNNIIALELISIILRFHLYTTL